MDRRSLRRAALRGGMAALAAAGAARLAGRRDLAAVAAAAAGAAGAGQEAAVAWAPAGGLVLAALARARRAGARPAAVVAASAGGVVLALGTRGLWPVAPGGAAQVRPARRVDLDPAPGGSGVAIAVNPSAGSSGTELAAELRAALPEARVVVLDDPADLTDVLVEAARAGGTRAVGVAGGDGSINAAAGVACEHGLPLVVVPGGTLNHLARDLGVDSVADVARAVVEGSAVLVDLPCIAGRRFLNTASFGSYAELVDAREALEDRIGKWPALAVALVGLLRRGTPIDVEVDGQVRSLWMAFVGNCRYQPDGFAPGWREHLDDGQLDVRLVDAGHPFSRTRLVAALLTGQLGRSRVYDRFRTTQLVVRPTDGALRLACDGETFDGQAFDGADGSTGGTEVVIAKDGTHLAIYAPS